MKKRKFLSAVIAASIVLSSATPIFTANSQGIDKLTLMTYALVFSQKGVRNPRYMDIECGSEPGGGNCTNFVSQCLGDYRAGALQQKEYGWYPGNGSYANNNYWWYNASDSRSESWTSATAFGYYFKNSKRCSVKEYTNNNSAYKKIFKEIKTGDIIQLGESTSDMCHSIICVQRKVDKDGYGTILFAQNSDDKTYTMGKHQMKILCFTADNWDFPSGWSYYKWKKIRLIKTSEAE